MAPRQSPFWKLKFLLCFNFKTDIAPHKTVIRRQTRMSYCTIHMIPQMHVLYNKLVSFLSGLQKTMHLLQVLDVAVRISIG